MNDRNYRNAFLAVLVLCALLAAGLGWELMHRNRPTQQQAPSDPVVAEGPPESAQAAAPSASAQNAGGPALAPIQVSPQRLQQIGVTTAVAQLKEVSDQLQVPGNVDVDEERLAYVQTRFSGWIQNVFANANWQYVRKGQRLFTIYSPDLVSTEQEYLLAKQNQKAFAPAMHTDASGMSPGAGSMAAQESGWLVQAAEERLRQFDVSPAEIAALVQGGHAQREIPVVSPASGYITQRNALPNAYVQPETKLYTIADLSTVWVYANVFQTDVGRLRPGDAAEITVDSYPGRTFRGRIDQILPDVDLNTRTARVRLVLRNPGLVLKPGMYVGVKIDIALGRQLVVPASGVLQAGTREIAFLDHGQGNLEPRVVQTGPQIDDSVVVLSGLKAGDRIVSSANFLVDSEAQAQSVLGSFSPVSKATGLESSGSAQSLQIDLNTDPSPPRKGTNHLRVRITGADGKAVGGAQVTTTFFMAAMPAMGMGAMQTVAKLTDEGQGAYSGTVELGSGGTWQVTIAVAESGKTVATKTISVTASGGM